MALASPESPGVTSTHHSPCEWAAKVNSCICWSRLTGEDIGRCLQHFQLPPTSRGKIKDALEALGKSFLPAPADGPSEGSYWHSKFYATKASDDELLKDNGWIMLGPAFFTWFQLAELVNWVLHALWLVSRQPLPIDPPNLAHLFVDSLGVPHTRGRA